MATTWKPVRCTTAPDSAPDWFRSAITEAGHELVGLDDAEALFWYHPGPSGLGNVLERGSNLRWVQLPAAGIEAYRPHVDESLIWTAAKGVYAEPVAEHALALALAGMRGLVRFGHRTAWSSPEGQQLYDADVVVVGGGGIATALIDLLRPFRTRVTLVRRHPEPRSDGHTEIPSERLHEVLPRADLVVVAAALTDETVGIIGADELALLPAHAWLVNISRGRHVVTDDLVHALATDAIGGAALDVTDPEPLPDGHPLWSFENCLITPHSGNTPDMHIPHLCAFMVRNLAHYANGEPLEGLVDPTLGY